MIKSPRHAALAAGCAVGAWSAFFGAALTADPFLTAWGNGAGAGLLLTSFYFWLLAT